MARKIAEIPPHCRVCEGHGRIRVNGSRYVCPNCDGSGNPPILQATPDITECEFSNGN